MEPEQVRPMPRRGPKSSALTRFSTERHNFVPWRHTIVPFRGCFRGLRVQLCADLTSKCAATAYGSRSDRFFCAFFFRFNNGESVLAVIQGDAFALRDDVRFQGA